MQKDKRIDRQTKPSLCLWTWAINRPTLRCIHVHFLWLLILTGFLCFNSRFC